MRLKLSDRFVKLATTGGRKSPIFMDDEVIGFGVQVRETGRKSFTLDYMFEGRRRRLYVGDVYGGDKVGHGSAGVMLVRGGVKTVQWLG